MIRRLLVGVREANQRQIVPWTSHKLQARSERAIARIAHGDDRGWKTGRRRTGSGINERVELEPIHQLQQPPAKAVGGITRPCQTGP